MNKSDHRKAALTLVEKIANERRRLHRTRQERKPMTLDMVKTLAEIDYFKPKWNDFDNLMNWIGQRRIQKSLENLIPSNKESWKKELQQLVIEGNLLQGRTTKQSKLQFENSL